MSTEEKKKDSVQCKYCNVYGLEWYKNDEGQNRLRWKGDHEAHTREECTSIKNKEDGFSFYDVIGRHKGSGSSSNFKSVGQPKELPEADMTQFVTALEKIDNSIINLAKSLGELKLDVYKGLTQVSSTIRDMQEKFSYIPGFDDNLSKSLDTTFKKGSEVAKEEQQ